MQNTQIVRSFAYCTKLRQFSWKKVGYLRVGSELIVDLYGLILFCIYASYQTPFCGNNPTNLCPENAEKLISIKTIFDPDFPHIRYLV